MIVYNPDWEKMKATLVSILRQKHIRFELIISDDGSENIDWIDKTIDLLQQYQFTDYRILGSDRNRGTVWNMFRACDAARGFFVRGLSPGDLFTSETALSRLTDRAFRDERYLAFGDSIYYRMEAKKPVILHVRNAPPLLFPYRMNHIYLMRLSYLMCGELICAANILLFYGDLAVGYLAEIVGKVKYAEDNIYRMMMFDGIPLCYIPLNSCFYEYGYGVSTSKNQGWNKLLHDDINAANDIMMGRENNDRIAERFQLYIRLQKKSGKYVCRAYKYFHIQTVILKLISVLFSAKTHGCTKDETDYLLECYRDAEEALTSAVK